MTSDFYNHDANAPIPFAGIEEEEPESPKKKKKRGELLFAGGMMGPMDGYMSGLTYPFLNPLLLEEDEEDEDPNP